MNSYISYDINLVDAENSESFSDFEGEMDCSEPNKITIQYPDSVATRFSRVEPLEILLNCSKDGFQVS